RDIVQITDFNKNWCVELSLLHNVFARNHNNICDMLKNEYPTMDDETLFRKARLVNAGISAKIRYVKL
ncbi:hypothetical protein HDV05_003115, partial [Chytridiales sp. JEL 0842]